MKSLLFSLLFLTLQSHAYWNFSTLSLNINSLVYTPFYISNSEIVLYSAGHHPGSGNGVIRGVASLNSPAGIIEKMVIPTGPDKNNYNYFRAARVARYGNQVWMLIEMAGCYSGCATPQNPERLGLYKSDDQGHTWNFLGFASVDGVPYHAKWFAHTGLVYNPNGRSTLDLKNPASNRFVTLGENKNIFVSNDGLNYRSVAMNHPFPKDRLVFASLAKTPFGFHLTSCANWNETYYTTTVRHLFSKDLINWVPIESNSFLKNPKFYKGVHLSYDEQTQKLWAISPCGAWEPCSYLAWLEPKDFSDPKLAEEKTDYVPTGEFVHLNSQTAMVTGHIKTQSGYIYTLRMWDGSLRTEVPLQSLNFPLKNYKRQGCKGDLCIGDAVYNQTHLATIMGFYEDSQSLKFALKYTTGIVDTGFTRAMLSLP